MLAFKIRIGDEFFKIEIAKSFGRAFRVDFEGKTFHVELPNEEPELEKRFSIEIDGKIYEVEPLQTHRDNTFQLKVEGVTFEAAVEAAKDQPTITEFTPLDKTTPKKSPVRQATLEGSIAAHMTGKVVSVKVRKGDVVKQGQAVCIIEAMKMENEIIAPKAGVVQEVRVSEGSAVNEGETLLVIA